MGSRLGTFTEIPHLWQYNNGHWTGVNLGDYAFRILDLVPFADGTLAAIWENRIAFYDGENWTIRELEYVQQIGAAWGNSANDFWISSWDRLIHIIDANPTEFKLERSDLGIPPDDAENTYGFAITVISGTALDTVLIAGGWEDYELSHGDPLTTRGLSGNFFAQLNFVSHKLDSVQLISESPLADKADVVAISPEEIYVSDISMRYTASQWTTMEANMRSPMTGDSSNLYAASKKNCMNGAHFDGTTWTCLDLGMKITIKDMAMGENGSVYILGAKGHLLKKTGSDISVIHDRGCTLIKNIAATENGQVYITCQENQVFTNTSNSWRVVEPLRPYYTQQLCGVGNTLYAATETEIIQFDGAVKNTISLETGVTDLFCSPGGVFFQTAKKELFRVVADNMEPLPPLPEEVHYISDVVNGDNDVVYLSYSTESKGYVCRLEQGNWQIIELPALIQDMGTTKAGVVYGVGSQGLIVRHPCRE